MERERNRGRKREWSGGLGVKELHSVTYIPTRELERGWIGSFQNQKEECHRGSEQCLNLWPSLRVRECAVAGGQSATSRASKWPQLVGPLKATDL